MIYKVIFGTVLLFFYTNSFADKPEIRITEGGYEHFYCTDHNQVFWADKCYYFKSKKSKQWNEFDRAYHWYKSGNYKIEFEEKEVRTKKRSKLKLRVRGSDGGKLMLVYRYRFELFN